MGVRCATIEREPWVRVSQGMKVKVRSKVSERRAGDLVGSILLVEGKNPALPIDAVTLAKAVAANYGAAKKKYDQKYVHITGVVTEKGKDTVGAPFLKLRGLRSLIIECYPDEGDAALVKVGDKAKVFGRVSISGGADKPAIGIQQALLITTK